MKKIVLLITICYQPILLGSFSMENRQQQGRDGTGFGGHPNRAAPGEVYRPKYDKPTSISASFSPPAGMSMENYLHMRAHYLEHIKHVDRRIHEARQEIDRYDDYELRAGLLDASEHALRMSHTCFTWHTYDFGLDYMAIAETALDLATSMTPGIGWARDVYETLSGKDAITGEKLSTLARTFAMVGAVTGGLGSKLKKPFEILGHMMNTHTMYAAKITRTAEKIHKANSPKVVAEIHDFLRRHEKHIPEELFESFEKAFAHPSRVITTTKDLKVFRYHHPHGNPRGQWVTTVKYDNPKELLALPSHPKPEPQEWILPKGTEVLEGRVAAQPDWAGKGGGYQIFVPNPEVLK